MLSFSGRKVSAAEVELLVDEMEVTTDEIGFDSFVRVMAARSSPELTTTVLRQSFRLFATSDEPAGYISIANLRNALEQYDDTTSQSFKDNVVRKLPQEHSSDHGTLFNYESYFQTVLSDSAVA